MKINSLFISQFRNIDSLNIDLPDKLLIYGKTGSGKTSVLEACHILLCGKSFKTSDIKESISNKSDNFFIRCSLEDFFDYNRVISIGYNKKGDNKILIDGQNSSRKELLNLVYPVVHSPIDMEIITGGPKCRRDFIDRVCFIEEKSYYDDMTEYLRYIKHKNVALKNNSIKTVKYLNEAAVDLIKKIRRKREAACKKVNDKIQVILNRLFPDIKLSFSYNAVEEDISEKLDLKLEKELQKGFSLYGPHLDQLDLLTKAGNAKHNVSMGETYLNSFLIKLAELYIYADKNIRPVFFIDDIFVFIDSEIKEILFRETESLKNQILMTSSIENANNFNNIDVFHLSK